MARHRLIALPQRRDARGSLGFAQQGEHIPFAVQRLFYLYDIPEGSRRGGHAHRAQHQFLIALHGGFRAQLDEVETRSSVELTAPDTALYVPPLVWVELSEFRSGTVCAVLSSGLYDESDYLRDYAKFREAVTEQRAGQGAGWPIGC